MFDGSKIKIARRKKGLKQKDAAAALGVPLGTYRNWEQSLHEPHSGHIVSMVKLFETSADFILGLTNNPEPYSYEQANRHAAYDGALDALTEEEKEELLMTVAIRREIMKKKRAQKDEQS